MFQSILAVLVALSPLTVFADAPPPDDVTGKWVLTDVQGPADRWESLTEEERQAAFAQIAIAIEDGKLKVTIDGQEGAAAFALDAASDPKTIDLTPGLETTACPGIYRLEDDVLTVCLTLPDMPRPKSFEAVAERQSVFVLKRVKPPEESQ